MTAGLWFCVHGADPLLRTTIGEWRFMSDSKEILNLQTLPLMHGMSEETHGRLAQLLEDIGERGPISGGEVLFQQGGLGGETGLVLLTGKVLVEREGEEPVVLESPVLLGEMYQLNPRAQRTATVTAKGPGTVLKFSWREFYAHAKEVLTPTEQAQCMKNIERMVLERFHQESLMDLPVLRGLSDHLRMRVSLALQWVSHTMTLHDGAKLFSAGDMCGDSGYLLTHGCIELNQPGQQPQVFQAPDIVGLFPDFNPDLCWTGTAIACGPVEVQRFAWLVLMRLLEDRLPPSGMGPLTEHLRQFAQTHFSH